MISSGRLPTPPMPTCAGRVPVIVDASESEEDVFVVDGEDGGNIGDECIEKEVGSKPFVAREQGRKLPTPPIPPRPDL